MHNATNILKKSGLKTTTARRVILNLLQNNPAERHLTAETLYLQLKNMDVKIGLATIYRILAHFTETGIVTRNYFSGGKAYFELANEWHLHLINELTGEILEIQDTRITEQLAELVARQGYEIRDQQITVYVRPKTEYTAAKSLEKININHHRHCRERKA